MTPSTSRHTVLVVPALALLLVSCGGVVAFDESPPPAAEGGGAPGSGGGGGAAGGEPLTCDPTAGPIDLVPAGDNPAACRGRISCEVWFGHGQHLSCPGRSAWEEPSFAECSIWDCICADHEGEGFVADFASGQVVDTRTPGVTCRYTLEPTP